LYLKILCELEFLDKWFNKFTINHLELYSKDREQDYHHKPLPASGGTRPRFPKGIFFFFRFFVKKIWQNACIKRYSRSQSETGVTTKMGTSGTHKIGSQTLTDKLFHLTTI